MRNEKFQIELMPVIYMYDAAGWMEENGYPGSYSAMQDLASKLEIQRDKGEVIPLDELGDDRDRLSPTDRFLYDLQRAFDIEHDCCIGIWL